MGWWWLLLINGGADYNGVFTGADIAEIFAGLAFDDKGVFVVLDELLEVGVVSLELARVLLFGLHLLSQVTIRPGLRQGAQEEGEANQAGDPDDGLGE